MKISISDVVSLIALIVAIQALVATVFFYLLKLRGKVLLKDVERIKKNSFFLDQMAEAVVDILLEIRMAMEFQNGLLARIIGGRQMTSEILERVLSEFQDSNFRIEKRLQRLMLFSNKPTAKESAFRQLAEKFGDGDTLRVLLELRNHEDKQRQNLEYAIQSLSNRINKVVRNSESKSTRRP